MREATSTSRDDAYRWVIWSALGVTSLAILSLGCLLPVVSNNLEYWSELEANSMAVCKDGLQTIKHRMDGTNWIGLSAPSNRTKRQARGCSNCCIPGHRGRPGKAGRNGKPGRPGRPGAPGRPGRPPIICRDVYIPPCNRCPDGPPGPPGGQGAPGNKGRPGRPGRNGSPGSAGPRGPPGTRGVAGTPGPNGQPGRPGQPARSTPNTPGDPGRAGTPGQPGLPGDRGQPGRPGSSGPPGAQGPAGRPGTPGQPGQPGRRGTPGNPGRPGSRGICRDCIIYPASTPGPRTTRYVPQPTPGPPEPTAGPGDCGDEVPRAFRRARIVPDALPVPPPCRLEARYYTYRDWRTYSRVFQGPDLGNELVENVVPCAFRRARIVLDALPVLPPCRLDARYYTYRDWRTYSRVFQAPDLGNELVENVTAGLSGDCGDEVPRAFRRAQIVPDALPVPPPCRLDARYYTYRDWRTYSRVFQAPDLGNELVENVTAGLSGDCGDEVPRAFRRAQIVPDALPVPPPCRLDARYYTYRDWRTYSRVFQAPDLGNELVENVTAGLSGDCGDEVPRAFRRAQIVPDALPVPPPCRLDARYYTYRDWRTYSQAPGLGNELVENVTAVMPYWVTWGAASDKYYTLVMFDLDSVSAKNPANRELLLWLVVNIPGADVSKGLVTTGQTIVEYVGPRPRKDKGEHRIVYLAYEQSRRLSDIFALQKFQATSEWLSRIGFRIHYGFVVGQPDYYTNTIPVAGNYHVTDYYNSTVNTDKSFIPKGSDYEQMRRAFDEPLLKTFCGAKPTHFVTTQLDESQLVDFGYDSEISLDVVQDIPLQLSYPHYKHIYYTIMFVDVSSQFVHWMIVNVPGDDWKKGETLVDYLAPTQKDAEQHRQMYVVLEQREGTFDTKMEPTRFVRIDRNTEAGRSNFVLAAFRQKWNLWFWAANYFLTSKTTLVA